MRVRVRFRVRVRVTVRVRVRVRVRVGLRVGVRVRVGVTSRRRDSILTLAVSDGQRGSELALVQEDAAQVLARHVLLG